MKISYKWLKELVDFDIEPGKLGELFTSLGFEVEEIIDSRAKYDGFVTAKVTKKEPHPDADKLSLCTVEYAGNNQIVVCGAPNVESGQIVVLGLEGATVPSAGFKLSKRKIRGIESNGMICSESELEVGEDSGGIWVLPSDTSVGIPAAEYLGLDDIIFDIFITPNRGDGNSHFGMAREIAACVGTNLKLPEIVLNEGDENANDLVNIIIENKQDCPRYVAKVIKGVAMCESPSWLQNRLSLLGLRPINLAADATNYVMMETGNPLHAFDFDEISGSEIIVKNANQDEKFTTLDGKEQTLDSEMLMICDGEKALAVAGVMGGKNSEITDSTKNILIEAAYFNPKSVRRTARKLSINSDSSYRFERGVDYENLEYAARRCASIITKYAGGKASKSSVDVYPEKIKQMQTQVRYSQVNKIIGVDFTVAQIKEIVNAWKFEIISEDDNSLTLLQPTWRSDLVSEIDYIEEIARGYDFNKIEPKYSSSLNFDGERVPEVLAVPKLRDKINNYFIENGFNECLSQNQTDPESASLSSLANIEIKNPLGQEMSIMRNSMIPSLLRITSRNLNLKNKSLKLFEIGKIFLPYKSGGQFIESISEEECLCVVLCGGSVPTQWAGEKRNFDFYDIKGIFEDISENFGFSLKAKENKNKTFFNTNSLGIFSKKTQIGIFGEIDKSILKKFDIEENILILILSLSTLYKIPEQKNKYAKVSPYPVMERDLAFILDSDTEAGRIMNEIKQKGGKLLSDVKIFDLYEGKNMEKGKKSLAFKLYFSANDRTLTEGEITPTVENIISSVTSRFSAQLRDK